MSDRKPPLRQSNSLFSRTAEEEAAAALSHDAAGAAEFRRNNALQRRRLLIKWVLLPVLVLIAAVAYVLYRQHKIAVAAMEEIQNRKYSEDVALVTPSGLKDAKIKIAVITPTEAGFPYSLRMALLDAVGTKPSEIFIEYIIFDDIEKAVIVERPEGPDIAINGASEVTIVKDGVEKTIQLSFKMDGQDLCDVLNYEFNRAYPDAQYPLAITLKEQHDDCDDHEHEDRRSLEEKLTPATLLLKSDQSLK